MKATIQVLAPIPRRWELGRSEKSLRDWHAFDNVVGQLRTLSAELGFQDTYGNQHPFALELVNETDADVVKHWTAPSYKLRLPYSFLKLKSVVEYDDTVVAEEVKRNSDWKVTAQDIEHLFARSACDAFDARLFDLCIATNLAIPGSLSYASTLLLVDGACVGSGHGAHHQLDATYDASIEYSWPRLDELSVKSVLSWLDSTPGFRERTGQTRLGRAIGALSYLIKEHSGDENELSIVWALLGLEALYGRGSDGIKNQILEKSEAFLGSPETHKKNLSRVYDHRSRIIHGDADIVFRHNCFHSARAGEAFFDQLYEGERVATAVLLATLQQMCADNRHDLEFAYTLE